MELDRPNDVPDACFQDIVLFSGERQICQDVHVLLYAYL